MWKLISNITQTTSVITTACLLISQSALANDLGDRSNSSNISQQIENYLQEDSMNQVNSVDQLRDVSPGDWAYDALKNLVENYNCIAGYPNGTFRGNRSMTRYEFAAGLNACLESIQRLIAANQSVVQNDLDTIKKLVEQFQAELTALGTRVDSLEARTKFLEDHQFSTTTKLEGEVVFGVASVLAGDDLVNGGEVDKVPVFGHRTRLELNTSFTGEDLLFTRLATGNFPEFANNTGTFQGELGFAQPDNNQLALEVLLYRFPVGQNTELVVGAKGMAADDVANTVNILDGDGGSGAISVFGTRNPIYFQADDGAGIGIIHKLGEQLELSAAYLATEANDPTAGAGLFDGPFAAIGQLLFKPNDTINIAATYVRGYNRSDTGTGSNLSNLQNQLGVNTSSDSFGVEFNWRISERFTLGGWGGFSQVSTLNNAPKIEQDVWNWAVTLALPDLGKEGNLAGIIVGMEPWVTDSNLVAFEDIDTSFHIEAFYQYKISDNISITPGVVWITSPGNLNTNDDLVIGAIRTTFSF
jgi:hypothetical protein